MLQQLYVVGRMQGAGKFDGALEDLGELKAVVLELPN